MVVSSIGRYSGGACCTMLARSSLVIRICHGAPGVTCSPAMKPSASQRCIEEVFIPRICAALRMETSSPSGGVGGAWNRGISRYLRRLPLADAEVPDAVEAREDKIPEPPPEPVTPGGETAPHREVGRKSVAWRA